MSPKIILINIVVFSLCLIAIEGLVFLFSDKSDSDFRRKREPEVKVTDPYVGVKYSPNSRTRMRGTKGHRVIYDYLLNFDNFGRRLTPQLNIEKRKKFLLMFGCSTVEGVGVADSKTLPSSLARLAPEYRVYNYGVGSWGTAQVLSLLEHFEITHQVPEKEGIGVYVFYDFHMSRSFPSTDTATWADQAPYYVFDKENRPHWQGLFKDVRPWPQPLYRFLSQSSLLKHFKIQFPLLRRHHHHQVIAMIKAIQFHFLRQFPHSRFLLAVTESKMPDFFYKELEKAQIEYVKVEPNLEPDDFIVFDGHHTASGNEKVALELAKKLQLN